MQRADSHNDQINSQPDQEIHANNLEESPLTYSQFGNPLNLKEKLELSPSMQNSNLDFTLGPKQSSDIVQEALPRSEIDFDLDREPHWAFEGEGLSYFSDKPKPAKVLVITWNLNGRKPGEIAEQLLNTRNTSHHIVAIATQECLKSIGMSFLDNSKEEWVQLLKTGLGTRFQMVKDHTMNAIHLAVFVRKEVYTFVRDVESSAVATGFANLLGNKGAVGVSFKLLGNSFLFLSCHLTCGQSEAEKRNQDFERIVENLALPWHRLEQEYISETEKSIFSHFDFVFCAGDLNYRIELDPEETAAQYEAKKFESLLERDQLNLGKVANKNIFGKFYEGDIRFAPTYKYELTSQELDTVKGKRPAWTDRILYAFNEKEVQVSQKSYDSNRKVFGSDHRPVFSQFLVKLDLSSKKKLNAGKEPQVKAGVFCGL